MEFAQLHHDALWVLDEVQLMDVGLATSVQLQAFRREDAPRARRPVVSWWMSATMQDAWLETCVDFAAEVPDLARTAIEDRERTGALWEVTKSVEVTSIPRTTDSDCKAWAERVVAEHRGGVTLVVANTVDSACALHSQIQAKLASGAKTDVRLVHSRFRGLERATWREQFLHREACRPDSDRIVIATQVVEAGVDMSADVLVTELAPWPSLVQRFGRCARYGGAGRILVVERFHSDASCAAIEVKKETDRGEKRKEDDLKTSLPYEPADVAAAAGAVREIQGADPQALEVFEASLEAERRAALYPYEPLHVLTRRELDDLFDTGPDLTGADLDISRFIRTGDERDVGVWWWRIEGDSPPRDRQPSRELVCPVPIGRARDWLKPKGGDDHEATAKLRAWVWDYLDGWWRPLCDRDVYPGQVILVDSAEGGYDATVGFTGRKRGKNEPSVPTPDKLDAPSASLRADLAQDHDDLSVSPYKTIATHGAEAADMARSLGSSLGLSAEAVRLLDLAARVHDLGKAHPVFAAAIKNKGSFTARHDLAKAPDGCWHGVRGLYEHDPGSGKRRGFRHELASTLGLFELLWRVSPDHPALLGTHRELLTAAGLDAQMPTSSETSASPTGFVADLVQLTAAQFDLVAWLVCTHHGKVRATWQSTPSDQDFVDRDERGQPLRGVREGDVLPATALTGGDGRTAELPALGLHLDPAALGLSTRYGSSWVERVARLRREHGPFVLAYLETLLRVADVRASRLETPDPLLQEDPS